MKVEGNILSFTAEQPIVKFDVKKEGFFCLQSLTAPELDEEAANDRQAIDLSGILSF